MAFSIEQRSRVNGLSPVSTFMAQETASGLWSTTVFERFLLIAIVVVLPLQDHIPPFAGFSSMFLFYGFLTAYILIVRPQILEKACVQPLFLMAVVFMVLTAIIEFVSPLSEYTDISRFGQMIAGGLVIASLCRDRTGLSACLYGFVAAALWVSVMLLFTGYGTLQGAVATDFSEASVMRAEAFRDSPIQGNLNGMAFVCAQGGIAALALALGYAGALWRNVFVYLAGFFLVACFTAMSRGAVAISMIAWAAMLLASGVKHARAMVITGMVLAALFIFVPDVFWSRLAFPTETHQGRMEARTELYAAALEHWDEFILTGVGAGNYWNKWGLERGFAGSDGFSYSVGGAHNSFLQVMINWGLLGVLAFIAVIWQAYRCLPKRCGSDPLALGLLGIAVSCATLLVFSHNFYDKDFSFGLGMLVGARCWIWPTGLTTSNSRILPAHLPFSNI